VKVAQRPDHRRKIQVKYSKMYRNSKHTYFYFLCERGSIGTYFQIQLSQSVSYALTKVSLNKLKIYNTVEVTKRNTLKLQYDSKIK
jgi:hypothetical protein